MAEVLKKGKCKELIEWILEHIYQNDQEDYCIVKVRKKRSLNANAYYHKLKSQLAGVLQTSNEELHEELLKRYSEPYISKSGEPVPAKFKTTTNLVWDVEGHWMPYKYSMDGKYMTCYRILGSSEMDTKQMSRLIDGLISECKEVGIETMTPAELASLKGYVGYAQAN